MFNFLKNRYFIASLIAVAVVLGILIAISNSELQRVTEFGVFDDDPVVKLLPPPGHNVRLLHDFVYTDPKGREWEVEAPHDSDGASIPKLFWPSLGGPLTGPHREAAIVHDYYCRKFRTFWPEEYKRDWKEVHRAFYYAMRARGVSEKSAKLMFAAVFHFGPRWEWDGKNVRKIGVERILGGDVNPEDKVHQYVDTQNPSLKDIEAYKPFGKEAATYTPKAWSSSQ